MGESGKMGDGAHEQHLIIGGELALEVVLIPGVPRAATASLGDFSDFVLLLVSDEPLPRSAQPQRQAALRLQDIGAGVFLVGDCHGHAADHLAAAVGEVAHEVALPILDEVLARTAAVVHVEGLQCHVVAEGHGGGAGVAAA
jgi:hypothetical protein